MYYKELERPAPDVLYGRRVHSWVLVLSSKRDVTSSFFIDSPTARHQLVDADLVSGSAEYLGVESVWNSSNYYVNMQECSTAVQVPYCPLLYMHYTTVIVAETVAATVTETIIRLNCAVKVFDQID